MHWPRLFINLVQLRERSENAGSLLFYFRVVLYFRFSSVRIRAVVFKLLKELLYVSTALTHEPTKSSAGFSKDYSANVAVTH